VLSRQAIAVLKHPGAFVLQTFAAFRANKGLLLAGAVAYYALLSIVPLLILTVIALSHVIDQEELLQALSLYLQWVFPGRSASIVSELAAFLEHRDVIGWVLLGTMVFFSSLAFSVLENAMSVIFVHRFAGRHRRFVVSVLLPYCYVLVLGLALLVITVAASALQTLGEESVHLLGRSWSLAGLSGVLLYLVGVAGEIFILASIYFVMPVGRLSMQHALIGGATAAVLWEMLRHGLVWYFATLSQVGLLYGSLATAIVVLLSLEVAATVLLFGAQVISEYERMGAGEPPLAPPMAPSPPAVSSN
jgi:YihY family inner membrane protein